MIHFLVVFPASFVIQVIQIRRIKQRVSGEIIILDFETVKNLLPEARNLISFLLTLLRYDSFFFY